MNSVPGKRSVRFLPSVSARTRNVIWSFVMPTMHSLEMAIRCE